ncbi:hypothetical protein ACIA8J_17355 [Streptomyces asoensis]|uniref:hypothetical protein n=1 Tax=Streptomyces asoensis TaxID=249586 RepID=UPI00378D146E
MTRHPALRGPFARPGRVPATAALALAALALCGCGDGGPGTGGTRGGPRGNTAAEVGAGPSSPAQAAFAAMLAEVARPCSPAGAAASQPAEQGTSGPTDRKPTGPAAARTPAPGQSPPDGPVEPGAPTGPEAELTERDRCASVQHEQRIVEALQTVSRPTPAEVRKTLNGLGYIDERIHGLEQDGGTTRFTLDLRESGGQLCEAGVAAGEATEVTACTVPATGAFVVP